MRKNDCILCLFSHSVVSGSLGPHGLQQACLSITNSQSLLKLMSIESVMPSNHLILCHPLLLVPSVFPSIRVFSKVSILRIKWPKYWSFSFSISPSNEYSGLISFRITGGYSSYQKHQFSALRLAHGPALTSIHECWEKYSLD